MIEMSDTDVLKFKYGRNVPFDLAEEIDQELYRFLPEYHYFDKILIKPEFIPLFIDYMDLFKYDEVYEYEYVEKFSFEQVEVSRTKYIFGMEVVPDDNDSLNGQRFQLIMNAKYPLRVKIKNFFIRLFRKIKRR